MLGHTCISLSRGWNIVSSQGGEQRGRDGRVALELSIEEGISHLADSASVQAGHGGRRRVPVKEGRPGRLACLGSIRGWRWLDSKGPRAGGKGSKCQLSGLSVARTQSALPFWRVS